MSDRFTEVTSEGYGGRLGGSLVAALFGLLLVPVCLVLLYWNEGRAVVAATALSRGAHGVVEVGADSVDPREDGRLVHVAGLMRAATPARDPVFGVSGDGSLRLSRTAEMYQWRQESSSHTEQSIGGSKTTETTYTYRLAWSSQPVASENFKVPEGHRNPPMPVGSATFAGEGVTLGAFGVDRPLLEKLGHFEPLQPNVAPPADYTLQGDGFYRGRDPSQPAVADLRVHFAAVPAQTVSVVGAQSGTMLTSYRDSGGYSIALAEPGVASAAALFRDARHAEGTLTWILRGAGFFGVLIGFVCLAQPLTTVFAVLPFLESLVGAGAFLIALTLAVPVTLLTIGVAWVAHRPLIGVALLAGALAAPLLLRLLHPRRAG